MIKMIAVSIFALVFLLTGNAMEINQLRGNTYLKPGNIIWTTATDGRHVWFGTSNGLVEFDKETNTWKNFKEKTRIKDVHSLCWNGQQLFLGTFEKDKSELLSYNPASKEFLPLPTLAKNGDCEIWDILSDTDCLWLGTAKGVACLDLKKNEWKFFELGCRVLSLVQSGKDLYVGTENGLWLLCEGKFQKINSQEALSKSFVYAIALIDRKLWLGTSSGVFSSTLPLAGTWEHFHTENSGICSSSIYAIQKDGDCIWVAGDGGVSRFNPAQATWFSYAPGLGLYWDQGTVSSFCNDGKNLWFATSCGSAFSIKHMENYPDFIGKWLLIGPFEFDNTEKGFQKALIPELVNHEELIAEIKNENGLKVQDQSFYSFVDLRKIFDAKKNAICYAYTSIDSPEGKDVKIVIDCNDALKLWINQNLVLNNYRNYVSGFSRHTEKTVAVRLKKGKNDILLKIANHKSEGRIWGFSLTISSNSK